LSVRVPPMITGMEGVLQRWFLLSCWGFGAAIFSCGRGVGGEPELFVYAKLVV